VCSINASGSVFLSLSNDSINLTRLELSLTLTEILTTGLTVYFIFFIGKQSLSLVIVPVLIIYLSIPCKPQILPHGTLVMASDLLPIIRTVLCTFLSFNEFLSVSGS